MGSGMSKKVQVRVQTCKKGGGKELNLDDCDIYDKMPEKLTSLSSLIHLDISHNHLTSIATSIGKLSKLQVCNVSFNEIETLPKSIVKLTKLTELDLSTNLLSELPQDIGKLINLKKFSIAGNAIRSLPQSISSLNNLTHFDYGGSRLETIDNILFTLSSLKELNLSYNSFSSIPPNITQLSSLQVLNLQENKISEIPGFINKFPALRILNLEGNQLKELPSEIAGLIHLEILNVGNNNISSVSSLDFSQMHNMEELNFHHNQLIEFNEGVGQMIKLRVLNLEDNMIKKLPREVGWLGKTLRALLLARNKIVRLPGEIAFLNPTVKLSLDGNPLVDPFNMLLNNMKTLTHIKPFCVTYLKAYPSNCIAQGDSVLQSQAGIGTRFFIEARDYEGNLRVNGKDKFKVMFINEKEDPEDESKKNYAIVKDLDDGTYQIAFNNRLAGIYRMHVTNESVHIRNSPFTHQVFPGPTNPANCMIIGGGISDGSPAPTSAVINSFIIQANDQFGNTQLVGGEQFTVSIVGGNNPVPLVEDQNNGTYKVQWTPAWPGGYEISIGYSGYHIGGSPFQVMVAQ